MDWNLVVAELGPKLYRYFLGSFSAPIADELTQDTLIRLVRKVEDGSFKPEAGTLIMYAFGIARLVQLEAYREARHYALTAIAKIFGRFGR